MKFFTTLTFCMTVGIFVSPVHADEYGDRFYNQTPVGMAPYTVEAEPMIAMDDIAKELQDIMPAAGEKDDVDFEGVSLEAAKDAKSKK